MTEAPTSFTSSKSGRNAGCASVLGALLAVALFAWPVGVWLSVAWWLFKSGWTILPL